MNVGKRSFRIVVRCCTFYRNVQVFARRLCYQYTHSIVYLVASRKWLSNMSVVFPECGNRDSIRDQVVPVLILLQSTESHLCSWNVLLWVLEVFELLLVRNCLSFLFRGDLVTYESVFLPLNSLCLVGIGVCETWNGTSVTAEQSVKVGTDLVSFTLTESMALSTSCLEEVGTLLCVTWEREETSAKVLLECLVCLTREKRTQAQAVGSE